MYYYKTHYITATLRAEKQTESARQLDMPECGWYQLYSYYLTPDTPLTASDMYYEKKDQDNKTYRLSLLEFNISSYITGKLDAAAKNNIKQVLDFFSETKSKVIVRFLYDWDGAGLDREPATIDTVKQHMAQVGKILTAYSDIIYTTQGIFVGSWAEMHSSKFLSDEEMTELALYFASVTGPDIYLAVRTPEQYQKIFKQLENHPEKYKEIDIAPEELKARLGLFNDGMLGSISDVGTYHAADTAKTTEEGMAIRQEALDFQDELCRNVPNGGETVNNNIFNDTDNAIADLAKMHVSYLNQKYDGAVIDKWRNSIYHKDGSVFDGMSTYDYITRHMGARFVIKDCSLSYRPFQKGKAEGKIQIENVGFSNLYHEKKVSLILASTVTDRTVTLLDSEENDSVLSPSQWDAGEVSELSFAFSPFDLSDGTYRLYLSLADPGTGESIPFANDSYEEAYSGYYLGEITIAR